MSTVIIPPPGIIFTVSFPWDGFCDCLLYLLCRLHRIITMMSMITTTIAAIDAPITAGEIKLGVAVGVAVAKSKNE